GREHHEEGVALGFGVDRPVALERLAEQAPVLGEEACVRVPGSLQQPRRAFDVTEEQRDCLAGRFGHANQYLARGYSGFWRSSHDRASASERRRTKRGSLPKRRGHSRRCRKCVLSIQPKSESRPQSALRQVSLLPFQSSTSLRSR